MKAVILIGGEGTRLRPLTCKMPKAVVPILNQPFMEHLICYLARHNVRDIILAMGFLPDPIRNCLGDGTQFGVRLTYSVEDTPLGTAGAVKNAENFLDEPFIVFNGDVLTEIDLTAMLAQHQRVKAKASIALTPVDDPTIYGVVETDSAGMVQRFVEKPSWDKVTTNMINAGIYILEPEVMGYVPADTRYMFEHHLFPLLLEKGEPFMAYPSDAYWIDIGTPEKYLKANHDLLLQGNDNGLRTEGESTIHSSVRFDGPVLIANGCVIAEDVTIKGPAVLGSQCEIGKGATLEGIVALHNSRVGEGAELSNCILCPNAHVQENARVSENCVLGDSVTVDTGAQLECGTKVWPDDFPDPNAVS